MVTVARANHEVFAGLASDSWANRRIALALSDITERSRHSFGGLLVTQICARLGAEPRSFVIASRTRWVITAGSSSKAKNTARSKPVAP